MKLVDTYLAHQNSGWRQKMPPQQMLDNNKTTISLDTEDYDNY
jgi:hypothetical protein